MDLECIQTSIPQPRFLFIFILLFMVIHPHFPFRSINFHSIHCHCQNRLCHCYHSSPHHYLYFLTQLYLPSQIHYHYGHFLHSCYHLTHCYYLTHYRLMTYYYYFTPLSNIIKRHLPSLDDILNLNL